MNYESVFLESYLRLMRNYLNCWYIYEYMGREKKTIVKNEMCINDTVKGWLEKLLVFIFGHDDN